jgi:hypothetical protein
MRGDPSLTGVEWKALDLDLAFGTRTHRWADNGEACREDSCIVGRRTALELLPIRCRNIAHCIDVSKSSHITIKLRFRNRTRV